MNESWSAVVLAGVHDWGACPLNEARLRPLVPVANRPVIEHVLRALSHVGVERAAICTNGHGSVVRDALGDTFGGRLQLTYHDDTMPRGPAGCVKDAASDWSEGPVLVVEASIIPCFDVDAMLRNHVRSGAALTVATRRRSANDESSYTPVGMYAVSADALAYVGDKGFRDIKEGWIPALHEAGLRVDVHSIDGVAPRLQGISSYFAINDWAVKLAARGVWNLDGYGLEGAAMIHVDARVDPSAKLLGPVIVGPGAVVRAGAIVVGPTTLERHCDIGEGAVVSRTVVWADGVVGSGAYVDRCVVADEAGIPPDARYFNEICLAGADSHRRRPHGAGRGELKADDDRGSEAADTTAVGLARSPGR